MLDHFADKPFLKDQAQGLQQYTFSESYMAEEESLLKSVETVHVKDVPPSANVVNIHVL